MEVQGLSDEKSGQVMEGLDCMPLRYFGMVGSGCNEGVNCSPKVGPSCKNHFYLCMTPS